MSENRDHRIHIRVPEEEKKQLEAASSQFKTKSLSTHVRKMAFDDPIINLQILLLGNAKRRIKGRSSNSAGSEDELDKERCLRDHKCRADLLLIKSEAQPFRSVPQIIFAE